MIDSVSKPVDLKRARRVKGDRAVANIDRLPPHAPEMEIGVLGCQMLDPNVCIPEVMLRLRGDMAAFYDLRHQIIQGVLFEMAEAMEPVDLVTVQNALKTKNLLDQVGGIPYLSFLQEGVPSAAHLSYYLDKLQEKHLLRKLIQTCTGAVGRIYDFEGDVAQLLDEFEQEALGIRISMRPGGRELKIETIQQQLIETYERALAGVAAGLKTGFTDIDYKLGGCMPQELIIIGGTPSAGKTTLAMNIAYNIAVAGEKVSFKSLETSATKMVHRIHCYAGQVDSGGFLRGQATDEQMDKMIAAVSLVRKQRERLMITDEGMTDAQLVASCRQDYQKGARLFVVDMLQNVQAKGKDEFAIVTAASKCLKNIAKELKVPVIAVSSLSRMQVNDNRQVRRPTMHDVRQSGQIESDADKMILLHSPEREGDIRQVTAIIAKNKDGPLGDIDLTFFANQFRFESAAVGDDPVETQATHNDP